MQYSNTQSGTLPHQPDWRYGNSNASHDRHYKVSSTRYSRRGTAAFLQRFKALSHTIRSARGGGGGGYENLRSEGFYPDTSTVIRRELLFWPFAFEPLNDTPLHSSFSCVQSHRITTMTPRPAGEKLQHHRRPRIGPTRGQF